MLHQPLLLDRVHPPNKFVPRIVSPLSCPDLFVIYYSLFIFSKNDKCHISIFNALIMSQGVYTSTSCLTQLHYKSCACTNFQNNCCKAVGRVCNTKLLEFDYVEKNG